MYRLLLSLLFLLPINIAQAQFPPGVPDNIEEIIEEYEARNYPNFDEEDDALAFDVSLYRPEKVTTYHSHQSSNVALSNRPQDFSALIEDAGGTKELQGEETKKLLHTLEKKLDNILTLKKLPNCKQDTTYGVEVANNTQGSDNFDYLFYNPKDKKQKAAVSKLPFVAIPYITGNTISAIDPKKDPRPMMAIITGVRCLPTRVNFTYENNTRYFTYKEGTIAYTAIK